MEIFWTIVNHPDASLIKFEVAKGLKFYTSENTSKENEQIKQLQNDESTSSR